MPEALRFARSGTGAVGAGLLLFVVAVALVGPLLAPYPPERPIGIPYEGPSADAILGTDFLGRDVLSRVLWGGRSVIALAGLSVLLAYAGGLAVGLAAGYSRGLLDPVLMRSADVLLSLPALLFLLVLVTGLGSSRTVLVVGVALIQLPLVARIIRSATQAQSVRGFVEAAAARGERTSTILGRELLPNIVPTIAADIGLRLTYAIILVASVNFLGLGLQPPDADWGLMVSENRSGLNLSPLAVLGPATMIALLTIAVNMVGDAVARQQGVSATEVGART
ncbi:MAG TPA: ABC transporter permease [Gaiellaceae bacterium]|nr:ABC transporter permease [Gaiellaceae bacterium]